MPGRIGVQEIRQIREAQERVRNFSLDDALDALGNFLSPGRKQELLSNPELTSYFEQMIEDIAANLGNDAEFSQLIADFYDILISVGITADEAVEIISIVTTIAALDYQETPATTGAANEAEAEVETQKEKELNPNVRFFIEKARGYDENFLFIEDPVDPNDPYGPTTRREIDITSETLTTREKQKVLSDLHWFVLDQLDSMYLDDIPPNGYAISNKRRLRIKGTWKSSADNFLESTYAEKTFKPAKMGQWSELLHREAPAVADLFDEVWAWVEGSYISMANQAKEFIQVLPSGGKAPDKDIIEVYKSDKTSFGLERLANLLAGARFVEGGAISKEAKESTIHNRLLGDLTQLALHFYNLSYQEAEITVRGRREKVPLGFPLAKGTKIEAAYELGLEWLLEQFEQQAVSNPEVEAILSDPRRRDLILKRAMQIAYDIVWAYGLGVNFDRKATRSGFAEEANSSQYHDHTAEGLPEKTVYLSDDDTSKFKTPVIERAWFYPHSLDTIYTSVVLRREDIIYESSEQAVRKYFEEFLFNKYGQDLERVKKSREFREVIGQVPPSVFFTDNSRNQVDYAAIAQYFSVVQMRPEASAMGISGDQLLIPKNETFIKDDPNSPFVVLKMSVYDSLMRLKAPVTDKTEEGGSGISLWRWTEAPEAEDIKNNLVDLYTYENQFGVRPINLKEEPIFDTKLRDKIEWRVDAAAQIISLDKTRFSIVQNVSKLYREGGVKVLKAMMPELRKASRDHRVDMGTVLFDRARQLLRVQPETVGQVITQEGTGFPYLNDRIRKYYLGSYLGNESSSWSVPEFDSDGNLVGVKQEGDNNSWPRIFRRTYRNPFIPWFKHANFASERAFAWQRVLDNPNSSKKDKAKAKFALLLEEPIFTIFSGHISRFMYPIDAIRGSSAEDQEALIMRNYFQESKYRKTIAGEDQFIRWPEDIEIDVRAFTAYVKNSARAYLRSELNRFVTDQEVETFLEGLRAPGVIKDPSRLDTYGYSPIEIEQMMLGLFALKNISSGPGAGGVALDWIPAAVEGKVDWRSATQDQVEQYRETHKTSIWGTFGGTTEKK